MSLSDFDLIALVPRHPQKRATSELLWRLKAQGHQLEMRSLQRRLMTISEKHLIVADMSGKPYGWSIKANAPATLRQMSVEEALMLKLAQRYLASAVPADLMQDLEHYFKQADGKLKEESLYGAWLNKVRILPANQELQKPTIARNLLTSAYDGVLRQRVLNVTYKSKDASAKTYEIEPLGIVVRGVVTYLIAQLPWADDVNLMALHRFTSIKVTDREIQSDRKFNLDEFIASGALGFMSAGVKKVKVRFYNGAGDHLKETPIAQTQKLQRVGDKAVDLIVSLPITEQFKWWILGFGEHAEVVSPLALRREIGARLTAAQSRYQDKAFK